MDIKSPRQQLEVFRSLIEGRTLDRKSPTFNAALIWMRTFPGELTPEELVEFRGMVCKCWGITERELDDALAQRVSETGQVILSSRGNRYSPAELERARKDEEEFDALVPKTGFFRDYIEYTRESEAPIAYHFFTAVVGMAATVNRRVGFLFGPVGKIYPPLGIILLGPSGIKKTSSSDIMVGMLIELGIVPLYSEKVTPEALVDGMAKGKAIGLVYAPEMAVFLGKAAYMEGIIPLLTRLMDSPDKWTSTTIGRGDRTLSDVAITTLMCSTADWFVANTPADMFGGGFIARNLLIHQTISPRIIPIPRARDEKLKFEVMNRLAELHEIQGEAAFDKETDDLYQEFYYNNKMQKPEHEMLEAYHQRKGSHLIRLSMMLHLSTHHDLLICGECFNRAQKILEWTEKFLPSLLTSMFRTEAGIETATVERVIRAYDGPIPHSILIRKLQYKMNALQVKKVIAALKDAGTLEESHTKFAHTYQIKEENE